MTCSVDFGPTKLGLLFEDLQPKLDSQKAVESSDSSKQGRKQSSSLPCLQTSSSLAFVCILHFRNTQVCKERKV